MTLKDLEILVKLGDGANTSMYKVRHLEDGQTFTDYQFGGKLETYYFDKPTIQMFAFLINAYSFIYRQQTVLVTRIRFCLFFTQKLFQKKSQSIKERSPPNPLHIDEGPIDIEAKHIYAKFIAAIQTQDKDQQELLKLLECVDVSKSVKMFLSLKRILIGKKQESRINERGLICLLKTIQRLIIKLAIFYSAILDSISLKGTL